MSGSVMVVDSDVVSSVCSQVFGSVERLGLGVEHFGQDGRGVLSEVDGLGVGVSERFNVAAESAAQGVLGVLRNLSAFAQLAAGQVEEVDSASAFAGKVVG